MSEISRYGVENEENLFLDSDGGLVDFRNYEKLLKEIARLKSELCNSCMPFGGCMMKKICKKLGEDAND